MVNLGQCHKGYRLTMAEEWWSFQNQLFTVLDLIIFERSIFAKLGILKTQDDDKLTKFLNRYVNVWGFFINFQTLSCKIRPKIFQETSESAGNV